MNDDTLSFVMSSRSRQDVLLALNQQKMTVIQLSSFLNKSPTLLYRIVKELTEKKLLTHNNVSRYRIYKTTRQGKNVLKYMGVIK